MNVLNYCLRGRVDTLINSAIKRSYTVFNRGSVIHNNSVLSPVHQSCVQLVSYRCFMKKTSLKSIYDVYKKKAAKDKVSSTEYELIYNGTGETYVRCLSGIIVASVIFIPSVLIIGYIYTLFTEGKVNLKTYLDVLLIPHSATELAIMLPVLFLLKIMSYNFISKYVLRVYRHNTKTQHIGVYINPILPWKNISCTFETAIKLPDGKLNIIPWNKEYYQLSGYKSIILKDRFKRPIDHDRMVGLVKPLDER